MKVYNYHPTTGRFLYEEEADPDPLTPGSWLIPGHSTVIEPPVIQENEVAFFDEKKKEWIVEIVKQPVIPYYILRAREYPPIFEYIDGIVKNDHSQINKYIQQCLEVKAKYPKPETELTYEI